MERNDYQEIALHLPKPPSLNQFYAGRHYAVRTKHKADYWKNIERALETHDKFTMERYSIHVRYNCRYDVDNAICCCKFLADYLRNNGYVVDDTPKYFTEQTTRFDDTVEKNTFIASIRGYGYRIIEQGILHGDIENAISSDTTVRKPARRTRKSTNRRRKTS